jgi:Ca-activated chloride channel family protein
MKPVRPLALALAALSLTTVHGQFRSTTELVSVYATVQDQTSRLVPDLTQGDFVITDNGKEQPITVFSNDIAPFSVVVMLDRSGSLRNHQIVIRDAAMAFVVRLLPDDQARIGSFGDRPGNTVVISPPAFTSAKDALVDVLRPPVTVAGNSPVWYSIDQAITALTTQTGRRVVVIFTDGHDEPVPMPGLVDVQDLLHRVRQANVMLYALAFSDDRRRRPDPDLRKLADDSGGGYFEVTDTERLGPLFTRVAEELHRQYWLGFVPPLHDGKAHRIDVKVKRPGLTVRARQTYIAPF